jgi:hypothetical protein
VISVVVKEEEQKKKVFAALASLTEESARECFTGTEGMLNKSIVYGKAYLKHRLLGKLEMRRQKVGVERRNPRWIPKERNSDWSMIAPPLKKPLLGVSAGAGVGPGVGVGVGVGSSAPLPLTPGGIGERVLQRGQEMLAERAETAGDLSLQPLYVYMVVFLVPSLLH